MENGDAVRNQKKYMYPNQPQLYNLEEDISETTNLIAKHPKIVVQMKELYNKWNQEMPGPLNSFGKPKKKKKWKK